MKLSIITINFNNGPGLTRTMESVILQTFKDIEYIVIDGGSTDGSIDVIKQNSGKLTHWVSEPDKGIYNAMNKGIKMANGEYLLFLNSGDRLVDPLILEKIIPELKNEAIIFGNGMLESPDKKITRVDIPAQPELDYFINSSLFHPSAFIKKELFDTYGLYNEANKIVSDWEFFIRTLLVNNVPSRKINMDISVAEENGISRHKENRTLLNEEINAVLNRYFPPAVIAMMTSHKKLKEELQTLKGQKANNLESGIRSLIKRWKKKI